eukprot:jgi/Tetstr1/422886/TSEL_001298.t1
MAESAAVPPASYSPMQGYPALRCHPPFNLRVLAAVDPTHPAVLRPWGGDAEAAAAGLASSDTTIHVDWGSGGDGALSAERGTQPCGAAPMSDVAAPVAGTGGVASELVVLRLPGGERVASASAPCGAPLALTFQAAPPCASFLVRLTCGSGPDIAPLSRHLHIDAYPVQRNNSHLTLTADPGSGDGDPVASPALLPAAEVLRAGLWSMPPLCALRPAAVRGVGLEVELLALDPRRRGFGTKREELHAALAELELELELEQAVVPGECASEASVTGADWPPAQCAAVASSASGSLETASSADLVSAPILLPAVLETLAESLAQRASLRSDKAAPVSTSRPRSCGTTTAIMALSALDEVETLASVAATAVAVAAGTTAALLGDADFGIGPTAGGVAAIAGVVGTSDMVSSTELSDEATQVNVTAALVVTAPVAHDIVACAVVVAQRDGSPSSVDSGTNGSTISVAAAAMVIPPDQPAPDDKCTTFARIDSAASMRLTPPSIPEVCTRLRRWAVDIDMSVTGFTPYAASALASAHGQGPAAVTEMARERGTLGMEFKSPPPPFELRLDGHGSKRAVEEVTVLFRLLRHLGVAAPDTGERGSIAGLHCHVNVANPLGSGALLTYRGVFAVWQAWVTYNLVTTRLSRSWRWRTATRRLCTLPARNTLFEQKPWEQGAALGSSRPPVANDVPAFVRRCHALVRTERFAACADDAERLAMMFAKGEGPGKHVSLNLDCVATLGTVEFRQMAATTDDVAVLRWAHFCCAFVEAFSASESRWTKRSSRSCRPLSESWWHLLDAPDAEAAISRLQAAQANATVTDLEADMGLPPGHLDAMMAEMACT